MNRGGLDPDRATVEHWLQVLANFALDHVDGLATAGAQGTVGPEGIRIAAEVHTPIPEDPLPGGVERVRDTLARAVEASLVTPGPGYLAYIPGGGLLAAGLADLVADWTNRYTGLSAAAPGFCRLEADVLGWLASEFGYDEHARGLLTSGGSVANLSAIVTARIDRLGETADLRQATAYTSSQVHHSVSKSLRLAGIPGHRLVSVPVDTRWRMRADALRTMVAADADAGRTPFLVVSSAGTTNTGAVDPLHEIANVCQELGLWHHVDGAYGGAFQLCPEGRTVLAGIERADSITFDPHKGMFLPYGTGCLLVRDGETLRRAHMTDADYLQDFESADRSDEPPSPADYGPELSRDFRGLRLWLPLMLHGAGAFRSALSEKISLARWFYEELTQKINEGLPLEIVDAPQLSTVAFRLLRRNDEPLSNWNRRNADLQEAINGRSRCFLSSTNLSVADGNAFTLRICVLSFRTHRRQLQAGLEDVVTLAGSRG